MSVITIATVVLFANAAWDFISSVSIILNLAFRRCSFISSAHLALWVDEENRANHAACSIMAILLMQWAFIRSRGALAGPLSDAACTDSTLTYALEAGLVAAEVAIGNIHGPSGWFVVMACAGRW